MGKTLEGRIALVTGGTSGIGLAAARTFIAEGAYVFITGRREKELNEAVASLGDQASGLRADSSELADLDAVFAAIGAAKGRLDVLFVNAGGGPKVDLVDATEADFDRTFDLNVKGVFFTVQKALPLLADGASVILNASIAHIKANPGLSLYGASKAAVRALARTWILELSPRRIRVNVISPGPIETPGMHGVLGEQANAAMEQVKQISPARRMGQPEELGAAALFLASDASSYVNGVELFVDGGLAQI